MSGNNIINPALEEKLTRILENTEKDSFIWCELEESKNRIDKMPNQICDKGESKKMIEKLWRLDQNINLDDSLGKSKSSYKD